MWLIGRGKCGRIQHKDYGKKSYLQKKNMFHVRHATCNHSPEIAHLTNDIKDQIGFVYVWNQGKTKPTLHQDSAEFTGILP